MGFLQGCGGFHLFSTSVFNYLSGMPIADIIVDTAEVGDPEVRMLLSEVIIYNKLAAYNVILSTNFLHFFFIFSYLSVILNWSYKLW